MLQSLHPSSYSDAAPAYEPLASSPARPWGGNDDDKFVVVLWRWATWRSIEDIADRSRQQFWQLTVRWSLSSSSEWDDITHWRHCCLTPANEWLQTRAFNCFLQSQSKEFLFKAAMWNDSPFVDTVRQRTVYLLLLVLLKFRFRHWYLSTTRWTDSLDSKTSIIN